MSKVPYKVTPLKDRIDMFEVFQKFKQSVMEECGDFNDLLNDPDMFGENSGLDIGKIELSYFESNNSLMFSCNEGTLIMELCADKKTGNDYIYYREPNARQGVGKGTLVAEVSCNGTVLEKRPEIHKTDIDKTQYRVQKAFSFDALLEEFQGFRRNNVPKTVPVEYEQETGIVVAEGRLPTERIFKMQDIASFARILTDEERKIAYQDTWEGYIFRKKNDPFFKKENDSYYQNVINKREEFIIEDDYENEEFIIEDDYENEEFVIEEDDESQNLYKEHTNTHQELQLLKSMREEQQRKQAELVAMQQEIDNIVAEKVEKERQIMWEKAKNWYNTNVIKIKKKESQLFEKEKKINQVYSDGYNECYRNLDAKFKAKYGKSIEGLLSEEQEFEFN